MLIILNLKANGVLNPQKFKFVDSPGGAAFHFANEALLKMGAINEDGTISSMGRVMLDFPVDPFSAFCLTNVIQENETIQSDIITIISILNAENFFLSLGREKGQREGENRKRFVISNSDHLTKLNIFYKYCEAKNKKEFCQIFGLRKKTLENCLLIREQLSEILQRIKTRMDGSASREERKRFVASQNISIVKALENVIAYTR